MIILKNIETDLIQKTAWRLVRSAEDRMGMGKGHEKLLWCIDRISELHKGTHRTILEDYVRSAFINMKIELSALQQEQRIGAA